MAFLDISKIMRSGSLNTSTLRLADGSRVAVIGGGPAGSFFAYFLLDTAKRIDLKLLVDIYEPRNFKTAGPSGCNMCGGVIYESLIQSLAVEGINLPPSVVQRGIEYNTLHMDVGQARIQTPQHEKRIATTFRGAGPRDSVGAELEGLDDFLLQAALKKGAQHIPSRVKKISWIDNPSIQPDGRQLLISAQDSPDQRYDFAAVTTGVNTTFLKQIPDLDIVYQPPQTSKLLVREYQLGQEIVSQYLGAAFHAFLLDIPGLDYGAIIPKGKYLTVCLLSSRGDLDPAVMDLFLDNPAVKKVLPPDFSAASYSCICQPRINVGGSGLPFSDRVVFIGDSGVSRLYKDGIGAAYRTAKVAASTAVFQGISKNDFQKYYLSLSKKILADNRIGKLVFKLIGLIQIFPFARRAVLQMVRAEQLGKADPKRGMSSLMWDMLTGGASYKEVLLRALNPVFLFRFLQHLVGALISKNTGVGPGDSTPDLPESMPYPTNDEEESMSIRSLGKIYQDGEIIVRQGEPGDCMYVVQDGFVEIIFESDDRDVELNVLGKDDFFGEMAIFNQEVRTATVRARGEARILTVNHENLLKCIHEDPSLAYRLMQVMSERIDRLSEAVADLTTPTP